VREALQNSLDAKSENSEDPVKVRIKLSTRNDNVASEFFHSIVSSLGEHLKASKDRKIRKYFPDFNFHDAPPYLTIEDFGTTGLEGNTKAEPRDKSGKRWTGFFVLRGITQKSGTDLGRHGLGKGVFKKISQLNTYFGLTIRESDKDRKQLLMGTAILGYHDCVDEEREKADCKSQGFFAKYNDTYDDVNKRYKPEPIEDDETFFRQFKELFDIERRDEPGLSVVVLYPGKQIDREKLIKAVIKEYFYAILQKALVVSIEDSESEKLTITADNINQIIDGSNDANFKIRYSSVVGFVAGALDCDDFYVLKEQEELMQMPEWGDDWFSGHDLQALGTKYESGDFLAFQVPLRVADLEGHTKTGWFKIFLQRNDPLKKIGFNYFVRSHFNITKESKKRGGRTRGLVVIDKDPLTSMLGNAEDVSHVSWDENLPDFQDRYENGSETLDFIRECLTKIENILHQQVHIENRNLLSHIFPNPHPVNLENNRKLVEEDRKESHKKFRVGTSASGDGVKTEPPEVPDIPRVKHRFVVEKVPGGFTIRGQPRGTDILPKVEVRAAYATSHGDPFKKHDNADFDFANITASGITTRGQNYKIARRHRCIIEFQPLGNPFVVTVAGFDQNRDLIVDLKPRT